MSIRYIASTPLSSPRRRQSSSNRRLLLRPFVIGFIMFFFILIGIELSSFSSFLQFDSVDDNTRGDAGIATPTKKPFDTSESTLVNYNVTQQIVILAGPHKTGTTSMQTNMWQWTSNENEVVAKSGWVWPIPPDILEIETQDTHEWNYTPSKGFYNFMEALGRKPWKALKMERKLFESYNKQEVIRIYKQHFHEKWEEGKNIIFGTEAFDTIIKDPDHGVSILKRLNSILPFIAQDSSASITVVVMYRSPKIKHLISIWHQNTVRRTDPNFYEWLTTTANTLGACDPLGMVDMFLKYTSWNVVLLDSSGLHHRSDGKNKENIPLDASHVIACDVMNIPCEKASKRIIGLKSNAMVANVREDQRPPNVREQALHEMDTILNKYECNYQHLLQTSNPVRLKILYSQNLSKRMQNCQNVINIPQSRAEVKQGLIDIVLKAGKIEPNFGSDSTNE